MPRRAHLRRRRRHDATSNFFICMRQGPSSKLGPRLPDVSGSTPLPMPNGCGCGCAPSPTAAPAATLEMDQATWGEGFQKNEGGSATERDGVVRVQHEEEEEASAEVSVSVWSLRVWLVCRPTWLRRKDLPVWYGPTMATTATGCCHEEGRGR